MLRVSLPAPLDIPASVEMFRRSGDDMIDRWDGQRLLRTVRVDGRSVAYVASPAGTVSAPAWDVTVEDTNLAHAVASALAESFLPAPPEYAALLEVDPVVAALDARFPGLRPVRQADLLGALIRSISAQQVNLQWAVTTRRRLAETFGRQHEVAGEIVYSFDAARLAAATVTEIRALQFTSRKAEYIIGVAQEMAAGRLVQVEFSTLSDAEVVHRLTALRGIGSWTAEWILARTLGRPVVVAGDLGVRKAVGAAYLGGRMPSEPEVRAATAHWGASAGIAQNLVLQGYIGAAT